MVILAAAVCGMLFGFGLIVSGMALPQKVLNFLDLFGTWDPSLALVMAAALAVSGAGYALARRRPAPLVAAQWNWPTASAIDTPLLAGAGLFGLGWGLVGLCPGPALVDILTLHPKVIGFVLAMIAGMAVHDGWRSRRTFLPSRHGTTATAGG
jgi:uncharacterized membrane protein YedE/YeeE